MIDSQEEEDKLYENVDDEKYVKVVEMEDLFNSGRLFVGFTKRREAIFYINVAAKEYYDDENQD